MKGRTKRDVSACGKIVALPWVSLSALGIDRATPPACPPHPLGLLGFDPRELSRPEHHKAATTMLNHPDFFPFLVRSAGALAELAPWIAHALMFRQGNGYSFSIQASHVLDGDLTLDHTVIEVLYQHTEYGRPRSVARITQNGLRMRRVFGLGHQAPLRAVLPELARVLAHRVVVAENRFFTTKSIPLR